MNYFSMPADFKLESIDKYAELNKKYEHAKVMETYGQISIGNSIGSGRASELIPKIDRDGLEKYIAYSNSKGIAFHYTLNTTCLGNYEFTDSGLKEIVAFLEDLYAIGVRSITVAMPSLIELIRKRNIKFEIKSSTLCHVINANKARAMKNMGVERLVVDESINRDFGSLKRITDAFGDKVEVICNAICHKNCIYREYHYNYTSHDLNRVDTELNDGYGSFYSHRCMMQRCSDVSNIMKLTWIRPEDLKYYNDIEIHYFKIQGRQAVNGGDPFRTFEAYAEESYEGNFMELLDMFLPTNSFQVFVDNKKLEGFIKPFIENPDFCKNDCSKCNYCDNMAKKCMDYEHAQKVFAAAMQFYQQFDSYSNTIKSLETEKEKKKNLFSEQLFHCDID